MKKKILMITGMMILLIGLGGFWGYNKYFRPNQEIQDQLKKQFGNDFFYSFNLPKATDSNIKDGKSKDNQAGQSGTPENISQQTGSEQGGSQSSAPIAGSGSETITVKGLTQDEIINEYTPKFNYLQNVALSRLETLYSAALQEYKQEKKAGTLNRSVLAEKYIQAGTLLETSVDSQFYSILNAMQSELVANHQPTAIVAVKKNEYEKAKSAERLQLLAKARQ
ncbi:hypothetical protein Desaci_0440 [Desulfosporosinus acidiphilus SJ4]|uniref:Uncharacterized protein n=1 Tax=Desulfosporosinus acidiphilus (strain DSM 22704 / JCM 16185 / SJ4) TaxID=646529 RepID=I4D133_DESAJ|nr:hypothetical protein [Desulfosporosinus acidiphilus]AFM39507.1 hypothetical protein Desaci_0440 [Desulfosporosinus acidiphilus SJ4]